MVRGNLRCNKVVGVPYGFRYGENKCVLFFHFGGAYEKPFVVGTWFRVLLGRVGPSPLVARWKKRGIRKTVSSAVATTLFNILAFMVCRVLDVVLRVNVSGMMFVLNVREATRTGCRCSPVVVMVVLVVPTFLWQNLSVILITRTVPPVERLTAATRFIPKQTLPGTLCRKMVSRVLSSFRGMIRTIVNGTD